MTVRRTYPDVPRIADKATQDSLRKLWDQVYEHIDQLSSMQTSITSAQATIKTQASTITALQTHVNRISTTPGSVSKGPTISGGGPMTTPPAQTDNGAGALGCSEAGSNGHLTPPITISPESAGKIICGVGKEFPALLAIAADQPTRNANQSQLLDRMVWHLNQQGFPCSRYPTANGRPWILLFNVGSDQYAYRVVDYAAGNFTIPYTTVMVFSGISPNTRTVPDVGISD